MPRGVKGSKINPTKRSVVDIDKEIKLTEEKLKALKEERKVAVLAENSEKLMEINELITESGLSMAQIKAMIKEKKASKKSEPKKVRAPRKKKEEAPSITDEIMADKE